MRMGGVSLLDVILIFVLVLLLVSLVILAAYRSGEVRGKAERAARGPQRIKRPIGFHLKPRRVVFKGVHKEFWTSDNRVHDIHQYEAEAHRTWLRLRPNFGFRVRRWHYCRKRGWHDENRKQGE